MSGFTIVTTPAIVNLLSVLEGEMRRPRIYSRGDDPERKVGIVKCDKTEEGIGFQHEPLNIHSLVCEDIYGSIKDRVS